MEGESHALLVFVKHQEMALYHKAWPNHVIVGLPVSADTQGLGAARFYIKVMTVTINLTNWLNKETVSANSFCHAVKKKNLKHEFLSRFSLTRGDNFINFLSLGLKTRVFRFTL